MPRDAAAVEGHSGVYQRHMHGMPDQVVDQHRSTADPQPFVDKLQEIRRREMVGKQIAAQEIEARLPKRKGQGISRDCLASTAQMGWGTVEQRDLQAHPAMLESIAGGFR